MGAEDYALQDLPKFVRDPQFYSLCRSWGPCSLRQNCLLVDWCSFYACLMTRCWFIREEGSTDSLHKCNDVPSCLRQDARIPGYQDIRMSGTKGASLVLPFGRSGCCTVYHRMAGIEATAILDAATGLRINNGIYLIFIEVAFTAHP